MNSALKQYSKYLKKKLAADEILKDLQPLVLRELRRCKEGKAVEDDVEYHLTTKTSINYPASVNDKIKELREEAKAKGKCKTRSVEAFDAQIPRSVKENVLARVPDYRKYFGKEQETPVIVLGK